MTTPALADLRNVYDPAEAREAGFRAYVGVGR
jgi:UDPglucose 6-dehydrogenase